MSAALVETLRDSETLEELLAEADLRGTDGDVSKGRLKHVHTRTESGHTVVERQYRDEWETDYLDWDGAFGEVTGEGYFDGPDLEWVSLSHERLVGSLAGEGITYEHRDGEITSTRFWMA